MLRARDANSELFSTLGLHWPLFASGFQKVSEGFKGVDGGSRGFPGVSGLGAFNSFWASGFFVAS